MWRWRAKPRRWTPWVGARSPAANWRGMLSEMGYQPVTTVTAVGEYALRGGIVDVFPSGDELPLRVDLFGDEIDELHRFDPETQRTVEND